MSYIWYFILKRLGSSAANAMFGDVVYESDLHGYQYLLMNGVCEDPAMYGPGC